MAPSASTGRSAKISAKRVILLSCYRIAGGVVCKLIAVPAGLWRGLPSLPGSGYPVSKRGSRTQWQLSSPGPLRRREEPGCFVILRES